MDNVTHSLIGVLLARAALPMVGSLRGALWAGVLASNLPDIDLALTPLFDDAKLGYLVHHRGHTHTLLLALPMALGVAALARRLDREARPAGLVALSLVGAALHLFADSWNNYGVHPFWPLDSRWLYGDSVFIVEPWLWAALLPLARSVATWKPARWGLDALALLMAGLVGVGVGPVAGAGFVGLVVGGVLLPRGKAVLAAALTVGALLAFGGGSRRAEAEIRARMAVERPGERVLDVAITPAPARPWCWAGWVVTTDGETYRARSLLRTLAPDLDVAADCALPRGSDARSAPLEPADLPSDAGWAWGPAFVAPERELRALVATECRVDAQMRFLRVPFWTQIDDRLLVGDLRYDFEPEAGFSEIETLRTTPPDTRGCDALPPWRSEVSAALGQ